MYEENVVIEQAGDKSGISPVFCYEETPFDWNYVDILGSPRFTRLIGALTVEECDDIPALHLDAMDHDISKTNLLDRCRAGSSAQDMQNGCTNESRLWKRLASMKAYRAVESFRSSPHRKLLFELDPFPTSPNRSSSPLRSFPLAYSFQPRMSDAECQKKFRNRKRMEASEIIHLVETLGAKGEELYHLCCYKAAEPWFRRVITAKQQTKGYKPEQTLWACQRVSDCILKQGQYREAQNIHENLHDNIVRALGADHEVSVQSTVVKANLLRKLGCRAEEHDLRRQVLQIRLVTLGSRHWETVEALGDLATSLRHFGRHREVQCLLEATTHFQLEAAENPMDVVPNEIETIQCMTFLAQSFNYNREYDESEYLLEYAEKLFGPTTRRRCTEVFEYHQIRATTYRLQRRFKKSEEILRGLLEHHSASLSPNRSSCTMLELSRLLSETGRQHEAAAWLEKEYVLNLNTYGATHSYTTQACRRVGFSYTDQRRYNEARDFFADAIEKLQTNRGDFESRLECVQKINSWMSFVEQIRASNPLERCLETENLERTILDAECGVDSEKMSDIPDPLLWMGEHFQV